MHLQQLTTSYKCLQHICKRFTELWKNYAIFQILVLLRIKLTLRDLQHKISKCLRWRTCCSDEFGAQLYWQESSMKYSSHIGAVVVENVRIYHDILAVIIRNIKFGMPTEESKTNWCICSSLLLPTSVYNIKIYWILEKLCNFLNFVVAAYKEDLQHKSSKTMENLCSDEFGAQIAVIYEAYYSLQVSTTYL